MSEEQGSLEGMPTPEAIGQEAGSVRVGSAGVGSGAEENLELIGLWTKAAGWLVMALGAVTIVIAIHFFRESEIPPSMLVGYSLIGVSYVLAGQGLSEGYLWSIPLVLLACVLSPLGLVGLLLLWALGAGMKWAVKTTAWTRQMKRTVPSMATFAYAMWIGGVACILISSYLAPYTV